MAMKRWRMLTGIVAAILIIASGAAHTLVGWRAMRDQLAAAGAPSDLITMLGMGWTFGGVAMFAFGSIVIASFAAGRSERLGPVGIIALVYIVFGLGALLFSRFDPFFLVFVVPGLLLLVAASPGRTPTRS